jgi:23S rRNA (uracil1939-C5)-methyltransferase
MSGTSYRRKSGNRGRRSEQKLPRNSPSITLHIDRIGSGGDGIGEAEITLNYQQQKHRIFVPNTLAGEQVTVQPTRLTSQGIKAELTELVTASPMRANPACEIAFSCGGCQLQHMSEDSYRRWKTDQLGALCEKTALMPNRFEPSFFVPQSDRRRARFAFQNRASGVVLGFFARHSHHILELDSCVIMRPELKAILPALQTWLSEGLKAGCKGSLQINMADEGADILLITETELGADTLSVLSATAHQTKAARISATRPGQPVAVPIFVAATPHLADSGLPVAIPAGCFLQSSRSAEAEMQRAICDALAGYDRIVDLFCGVGTFSAPLLSASKQIWAVDNDEMAVTAYQQAAHHKGLAQTLLVSTRNLFDAPIRADELAGFQAAIIDPPRAGAIAQMPHIIASPVEMVVMVSCNPHSLFRDIGQLCDGGFEFDSLKLIDQFVWSTHCEAIAILRRLKP